MAIIEVTSREFRYRPKAVFNLADQGNQVIIRRNNYSYTLTPAQTEEEIPSPELLAVIERGLENIRAGRTQRYTLGELKTMIGL